MSTRFHSTGHAAIPCISVQPFYRLRLVAALPECLIGLVAAATCVWIAAYIVLRTVQQYPLDAFEEYELSKAIGWTEGATLYGTPAEERWPEAYPPLYFCCLGVWEQCFGQTFLVLRLLSLTAFAGVIGCGLWALGDVSAPSWSRLAFLTTLLSFDVLTGKFFEVGKPDTMFTFFLSIAIVAGRHRSGAEVVASSLGLWLACLTKQNAPLILAPLVLWHFAAGRRRWAILWGTGMAVSIAATYLFLNWVSGGNFSRWVFVWTAGHGFDFAGGVTNVIRAVSVRAPLVLFILAGSLVFRPRCLWTWCLLVTLSIALVGMSKAGGRENHLMPFAFVAALIAGRGVADLSSMGRGRWVVAAAALLLIVASAPTRRDIRWIGKRSQEARDWAAAVRRLDGRVAVSHHLLLARSAHADCFFSDLILQFRGLEVPMDVERRITSQEFDYLLLSDEPSRSATAGWSRLIDQHYAPVGDLEFPNISRLLPSRLFLAKRHVESVAHDKDPTAL